MSELPALSLVTIDDDALPKPLFRRLLKAVEALGERGLKGTYQRTFWHPLDEPPRTVVEEAIEALRGIAPSGATGAEWWLSRMRTSNVQVDFHRDLDERLYRRTGQMVHPLRGSVLFLNRCNGGLLLVSPNPPVENNQALAPEPLHGDLVEPQPNRLAFFDGRLTHGVLDARNDVPGRRLPREKQLRLTIPINWWGLRPTNTPRFGETPASDLYRPLASTPPKRRVAKRAAVPEPPPPDAPKPRPAPRPAPQRAPRR